MGRHCMLRPPHALLPALIGRRAPLLPPELAASTAPRPSSREFERSAPASAPASAPGGPGRAPAPPSGVQRLVGSRTGRARHPCGGTPAATRLHRRRLAAAAACCSAAACAATALATACTVQALVHACGVFRALRLRGNAQSFDPRVQAEPLVELSRHGWHHSSGPGGPDWRWALAQQVGAIQAAGCWAGATPAAAAHQGAACRRRRPARWPQHAAAHPLRHSPSVIDDSIPGRAAGASRGCHSEKWTGWWR